MVSSSTAIPSGSPAISEQHHKLTTCQTAKPKLPLELPRRSNKPSAPASTRLPRNPESNSGQQTPQPQASLTVNNGAARSPAAKRKQPQLGGPVDCLDTYVTASVPHPVARGQLTLNHTESLLLNEMPSDPGLTRADRFITQQTSPLSSKHPPPLIVPCLPQRRLLSCRMAHQHLGSLNRSKLAAIVRSLGTQYLPIGHNAMEVLPVLP